MDGQVTLMQMFEQGNPVGGNGVGFLYMKADRTFLVINQHSLCGHCPTPELLGLRRDVLGPFKPTHARIFLPRKADLTAYDGYDIPLFDGNKPLWHIHDKHKLVDVALVPVVGEFAGHTLINPVTEGHVFRPNFAVRDDDSLFAVLYPQKNPSKQEVLNVKLATPFSEDWKGFPFFLLRESIKPGDSGAPVFVRPRPARHDVHGAEVQVPFDPLLLGVCIGRVDAAEDSPTGVCKAVVIDEIAAQAVAGS